MSDLFLEGTQIPGRIRLTARTRKANTEHFKGMDTEGPNASVREWLRTHTLPGMQPWTFELSEEHDYLLDSAGHAGTSKSGFDFGTYDRLHNIAKVRNTLRGAAPVSKPRQIATEVEKRPHWQDSFEELEQVSPPEGWDVLPRRQQPTLLGEIQTGNHAMAQKDVVRLAIASQRIGVDGYVSIVPDGLLATLISDATVNFSKMTQLASDVRNMIDVPMLIVGLDVVAVEAPALAAPAAAGKDSTLKLYPGTRKLLDAAG